MPEIFWVAIVVMAIAAVAFVALPLIKARYRKTASISIIGLLVVAAGLYVSLGTRSTEPAAQIGTATQPVGQMSKPQSEKKIAPVASMVDGLAERLRENPDDGKSWLLLAQSYEHLNRIPEALAAYERAKSLGLSNSKLDALAASSSGQDVPAVQVVGRVSLSPEAMELVLPTDTVFVFARADGGPSMPLAVLRQPASELPISFSLSDNQSMSADAKLSDAENVVVTARISRSGDATETLQSLEAESNVIALADNEHVSLFIEQKGQD